MDLAAAYHRPSSYGRLFSAILSLRSVQEIRLPYGEMSDVHLKAFADAIEYRSKTRLLPGLRELSSSDVANAKNLEDDVVLPGS